LWPTMGNPKAKKTGGKKKVGGAVRAPDANVMPDPKATEGALDWGAKVPTAMEVSKGNPSTVAWTLREFGRTSAELVVAALQRAVELCKVSDSDACKENRQALLSAEVHVVSLAAMSAHVQASGEVQMWGASTLGHLSHGELANKTTVVAAGAIAAVVAAMKAHRSSASVQERSCWALRNLALGDSKRQDAVLEAGGLVATIIAMRSHLDVAEVQAEGCALLGNVSSGAAGREAFIGTLLAMGAATTAVAAMRAHPSSVAVLAQGIGTLGNLAAGEVSSQKAVADACGAEAIVTAMRAHADSKQVMQGGEGALGNIVWGEPELRLRALAAGAEVGWLPEAGAEAAEAAAAAAAAAAAVASAAAAAASNAPLAAKGGAAAASDDEDDESEDDMELDDEDMDGELVEALRPVLRGDKAKLKALDQAAKFEDGSAEQCAALKVIWRSLTPAQKIKTVESSDEEDDEAAARPPVRAKRAGKGRKQTGVAAVEIE
jgi:hypothetical protein